MRRNRVSTLLVMLSLAITPRMLAAPNHSTTNLKLLGTSRLGSPAPSGEPRTVSNSE